MQFFLMLFNGTLLNSNQRTLLAHMVIIGFVIIILRGFLRVTFYISIYIGSRFWLKSGFR